MLVQRYASDRNADGTEMLRTLPRRLVHRNTHPVLRRPTRLAVVRSNPVAVEVSKQIRSTFHPLGVIVERRAVTHQKFRMRMRCCVVEG